MQVAKWAKNYTYTYCQFISLIKPLNLLSLTFHELYLKNIYNINLRVQVIVIVIITISVILASSINLLSHQATNLEQLSTGCFILYYSGICISSIPSMYIIIHYQYAHSNSVTYLVFSLAGFPGHPKYWSWSFFSNSWCFPCCISSLVKLADSSPVKITQYFYTASLSIHNSIN